MKTRSILDNKYIFEYEVGLFPFGSHRVLRDRSSDSLRSCKIVAKNIIRDPNGCVDRLLQLKGLQGEHIAAITDVMQDSSSIYVISEFCTGGDVADLTAKLEMDDSHTLDERTCATYIRQALVALSQSHSYNVFHADLQPQNLMLTSKMPDAAIKVNDIGIVPILDPDGSLLRRRSHCSSYTAPEVQDGSGPMVSGAADMWSLGAMAHQLLVGGTPDEVSGGGPMDWFSRLGGGRNFEDCWSERSEDSRDFVRRLTCRESAQRLSAARALQHPWLRSVSSVPAPVSRQPMTSAVQPKKESPVARDKILCYTLAVLLTPVLVSYRDLEQLRQAFLVQDTDSDGLNPKSVVQKILLTRCSLTEAVAPALAIADVSNSGAVDFCATACADLIAREFFAAGPKGQPLAGPFSPAELSPRMLKRFFEIYGESHQYATSADAVRSRLQTATARDLERYGGVSFSDILDTLPANRAVDSKTLASVLWDNAGQGTPLRPVEYADDDDVESVAPLGGSFMDMFKMCSAPMPQDGNDLECSCMRRDSDRHFSSQRSYSPHSLRVEEHLRE